MDKTELEQKHLEAIKSCISINYKFDRHVEITGRAEAIKSCTDISLAYSEEMNKELMLDFGLEKISHNNLKEQLKGCESALFSRDEEIKELKAKLVIADEALEEKDLKINGLMFEINQIKLNKYENRRPGNNAKLRRSKNV